MIHSKIAFCKSIYSQHHFEEKQIIWRKKFICRSIYDSKYFRTQYRVYTIHVDWQKFIKLPNLRLFKGNLNFLKKNFENFKLEYHFRKILDEHFKRFGGFRFGAKLFPNICKSNAIIVFVQKECVFFVQKITEEELFKAVI